MTKMKLLLLPTFLLLLPICLGMSMQEDDLVFDDVGEETPIAGPESESSPQHQESSASSSTPLAGQGSTRDRPTATSSARFLPKHGKKWQGGQKLQPIHDSIATVAHVFKLHLSKDLFTGSLDYYEVRGLGTKALPRWLHWDEPANVLTGVPSRKDMARNPITLTAYGKNGEVAQGSFTIHVLPENRESSRHEDAKKSCREEQDRTILTILVDAGYNGIAPSAKVNALESLAGFLGRRTSSVAMYPESEKPRPSGGSSSPGGSSVIVFGPGNVVHRREKHSTVVQWQVGCDGHFWPHEIDTVKLISEMAVDGTLGELLQLPVYEWRVWSDTSGYERNRRQAAAGSGDDFLPDEEDEEYDEEEDYDDEDYEGITDSPQQPKQKPVVHEAGGVIVDEHPHRHHHGEDSIAGIGAEIDNKEDLFWKGEDINNAIFNSTSPSGSASSPATTIAVTLPSSSTSTSASTTTTATSTTSTTSTTTTTTTRTTPTPTPTTPQPPTSPTASSTSSTTSEPSTASSVPGIESSSSSSSSSSNSSASSEEDPSSRSTGNATTTTTTNTTTPITTTAFTNTTTMTSTTTATATPLTTIANSTTSTITGTSSSSISGSSSSSGSSSTTTRTTTETATLTYTNTSQVSTSSNVSTDALSLDNEDPPPTTEDDTENDTDSDLTTTHQPNIFIISEPTSQGGPASGSAGPGLPESQPTMDPNATSTLSVNSTTQEYTDASIPSREIPSGVNLTSNNQWGDNATEAAPSPRPFDPIDGVYLPEYNASSSSVTSASISSTTTSTTPSTTTTMTTTTTTTTTTTMDKSVSDEPTTTMPSSTSTTTFVPETTPITSTTTTTTTTTTTPTTTTRSEPSSSSTTTTERIIEYEARNYPPQVESRLKKIPVTQGKVLSYTIPEDAFSDLEDGNTRQLRLRIYENGAPLKSTYWLQFNEQTQEVYGLPLEEYYGPFAFEVKAFDSKGLSASNRLDVTVQQHKQIRAMNHEFHIYLKIEKRSEFRTNVDWELKVMRSLAELYGDNDLSYITVRSIDIDRDQAIYSWTNDSLARSSTCPQEEINRLYRALVLDEKSEEPSEELIRVLGPEIKPKRVVYQGLEQCQQSKETQVNKFPVPRNQIDQLNATVGQLFVYRVPKDTFFDEEDGDTGSMKASLLYANRTEIPPWDWLQFDSNNQEFYGVPLKQDIGRKTYQLIVRDREGLEATDSLVAEVHDGPQQRHVFEISMTLHVPYEAFANSAIKKREFIEKLQKLYGDKNASAVSIISINGNHKTTTVVWRNVSLPSYECPRDEVKRLSSVLVNDNKSFTDELNREFNSNSQRPEFEVIQITVDNTGACATLGHGGRPKIPAHDDSTSVGASHDDYLVTFVLPAIIIVAMLLLAGIIACILYKRRRSGKMSVSEKDDERQSFRSKGIPVIFQDELDEKPDPGNKSPIILKEEKPPLPPPEYQRAEDGADIPMLSKENSEEPYQPPPPFATSRDNGRQNRPKPTPTYRKPPPYVPP